jgi:hypothetical protein
VSIDVDQARTYLDHAVGLLEADGAMSGEAGRGLGLPHPSLAPDHDHLCPPPPWVPPPHQARGEDHRVAPIWIQQSDSPSV